MTDLIKVQETKQLDSDPIRRHLSGVQHRRVYLRMISKE